MINLDWTRLGMALRSSADDAHGAGNTPTVEIAYSFLLDNPEFFLPDPAEGDQEWPADMPKHPPAELVAAYFGVACAPDCEFDNCDDAPDLPASNHTPAGCGANQENSK